MENYLKTEPNSKGLIKTLEHKKAAIQTSIRRYQREIKNLEAAVQEVDNFLIGFKRKRESNEKT